MTSNDGWAVGGLATSFDTNTQGGHDSEQPGGFNNNFFERREACIPSGANFGAVDGAVHYLSNDIDHIVYGLLGSMADGGIYIDPTTQQTERYVAQFPDQ